MRGEVNPQAMMLNYFSPESKVPTDHPLHTNLHPEIPLLVAGIESMEEFLVGTLLTDKKLDIVNQQRIQRTVLALKFNNRVVLQRPHHIVYKALGMHIGAPGLSVTQPDQMTDALHQVGLTESHTTVKVGCMRVQDFPPPSAQPQRQIG